MGLRFGFLLRDMHTQEEIPICVQEASLRGIMRNIGVGGASSYTRSELEQNVFPLVQNFLDRLQHAEGVLPLSTNDVQIFCQESEKAFPLRHREWKLSWR